jgi:hypothetical protein
VNVNFRFVSVFICAILCCFPLWTSGKELAVCDWDLLATEIPVSGSIDHFISTPENLAKIIGERNPEDKIDFLSPVRRAFEFMDIKTGQLTSYEKSQLWTAIANAIHRKFSRWDFAGPYRSLDGAYVFQGGFGNIMVIRQRDGAIFMGILKSMPPRPDWMPTYRDLEPLNDFLEKRKKVRESAH